jgi:hypothetical protein
MNLLVCSMLVGLLSAPADTPVPAAPSSEPFQGGATVTETAEKKIKAITDLRALLDKSAPFRDEAGLTEIAKAFLTEKAFSDPELTALAEKEAKSAADRAPAVATAEAVAKASADAKTALKNARELLKNNSTVRVGVSIGPRLFIAPRDSLLRDVALDARTPGAILIDRIDRASMVLSGVVLAYPFPEGQWHDLGFIANINLANFSADAAAEFNKNIEGGVGLAWRFNEDFGIALTVERAFSRSLRDGLLSTDAGKPTVLYEAKDKTITAIDIKDSRFFYDENLTAVSLKFIYTF